MWTMWYHDSNSELYEFKPETVVEYELRSLDAYELRPEYTEYTTKL